MTRAGRLPSCPTGENTLRWTSTMEQGTTVLIYIYHARFTQTDPISKKPVHENKKILPNEVGVQEIKWFPAPPID